MLPPGRVPIGAHHGQLCAAVILALGGLPAAADESAAPAAGVVWEPVAVGARGDDVTALAVEPGGDRLAVGDARGALAGRPGESFRQILRRGPVRDLAFLPDSFRPPGVLLAATDRGLYRIERDGQVEALSPGPGEAARAVGRIAAAPGAAAVATSDGAFISPDTRTWQRLSTSLPAGAATAIALRERGGEFECWTVIRGELWRTRLRRQGTAPLADDSRRETIPAAAANGGPVDLTFDLPGAELAVVFPGALAVRRAPDAGWEILRPNLPPGASAVRIAWAASRLWLATDRGLLEAPALEGPWRRAGSPAGSAPVRALAASTRGLYAATEDGLLAGRVAGDPSPRAAVAPPARLATRPEPGIDRVRQAALAYLDLHPSRLDSLRRGVERRGWLPIVALRVSGETGSGRSVEHDEAFLSGDTRQLVDRDRDRSSDLEVALTLSWDLGGVAYHPEQIDVSRESREVIELRDDVLDEVTQLYFERRRVLVELAGLGDPDAPEGWRLRLRADELAAGIDAWTGGWFGRHAAPLAP